VVLIQKQPHTCSHIHTYTHTYTHTHTPHTHTTHTHTHIYTYKHTHSFICTMYIFKHVNFGTYIERCAHLTYIANVWILHSKLKNTSYVAVRMCKICA